MRWEHSTVRRWPRVLRGRYRSSLAAAGCGLQVLFSAGGAAAPGQPQAPLNLVVNGDSIAVSERSSGPAMTWLQQTADLLPKPWTLHTRGAGGRQMRVVHDRFAEDIKPLYDAGARANILLLHAGDNDISMGLKPDQIYEFVRRYVAMAHADGWLVVGTTELPRYDFQPAAFDDLARLNELIRHNDAGADAIADFAADPIMGPRENRTNPVYYFWDQAHPADQGYGILARLSADAISGLLTKRASGASP